jgi:8-oxo-dGTP pyrophosphatase MutT (NUDIX family)
MAAADELVDVIDETGSTVRVVTRAEMRRNRLPHRCVYILMFNVRGELFIHERTATKDIYPSYWDVAAGGVLAAGESFDEGAARECLEELGVNAELTPLFPFEYSDDRTIVQAYVYRGLHEGPFQLQPEEVVQGRFVGDKELNELIAVRPFCPDGLQVWELWRQRRKR